MVDQERALRVLIVEDNPANLLLVEAVLRLHGFRTEAARSPDELRALLQGPVPDLILMDLQLPGEDGLALTRALKADSATAAVPVVALTAHAMRDDRAKALAAGCAGYISKPINTRTLADELRAILDQTSAAGETRRDPEPSGT